MKRNTFWVIGAVLLVVLLLFLPGLLGRGGWMGNNYGMMGSNTWMDNCYGTGSGWAGGTTSGYGMGGYGMMGGGYGGMMGGSFLGWLYPVLMLVLVVAAGVWLGNALSNRSRISSSAPAQSCPNCSKAVATDWRTCPFCGTSLK